MKEMGHIPNRGNYKATYDYSFKSELNKIPRSFSDLIKGVFSSPTTKRKCDYQGNLKNKE